MIKEAAEVDAYVIDVVALTGEKQKYGNGTDGKTDVYKLEEAIPKTGSLEKVASTGELKIAAGSSTNKKYNVVYCKTESDKEVLGTLEDNAKNEDLITFLIDGVSYKAKKGMTWKDWRNSKYYEEKAGMKETQEADLPLVVRDGTDYRLVGGISSNQYWNTVLESIEYHTEKYVVAE